MSVLDALALTLLILGAIAWLWTGQWRFMLTGAGLTLAALMFSAAMERQRITPPAE
jgi:uncharacterized membrane protein YuzA (DUF378 family)